jgi:hypothetical protein
MLRNRRRILSTREYSPTSGPSEERATPHEGVVNDGRAVFHDIDLSETIGRTLK